MRFSIVVPTYNRAQLLSQALDSVLAQTLSCYEIVVIDDGSTDDTAKVVSSYGQQVQYFCQENKGKPAALNAGIGRVSGDVIVVLDDDDFFPPWALAKHAAALERNPAADFSYGRFVRFRGTKPPPLSETQDMEVVPTRDPRRLVVKLMENCFLPNPSWAVRRSAQLRVGPYKKSLYYNPDYDMILRLARKNEGAFIDKVVLFQRKHLGHRGPMSEQSYIVDTVDKWIKYDADLFREIDREWDIAEFFPFSDELHSEDSEGLALLQKGIILFQRKVYDGAAHSLAQYRMNISTRSPTRNELRIAAGLLGCRYGLADLVAGGSESEKVIQWLRGGRWPILIRMAFASQQRWRIRQALSMGDMRYIFQIVRFSCKAFGADATAAVLGSWYRAGAHQWKGGN
jgi:glycosyltransferase involved in cell wall biosynthesis